MGSQPRDEACMSTLTHAILWPPTLSDGHLWALKTNLSTVDSSGAVLRLVLMPTALTSDAIAFCDDGVRQHHWEVESWMSGGVEDQSDSVGWRTTGPIGHWTRLDYWTIGADRHLSDILAHCKLCPPSETGLLPHQKNNNSIPNSRCRSLHPTPSVEEENIRQPASPPLVTEVPSLSGRTSDSGFELLTCFCAPLLLFCFWFWELRLHCRDADR